MKFDQGKIVEFLRKATWKFTKIQMMALGVFLLIAAIVNFQITWPGFAIGGAFLFATLLTRYFDTISKILFKIAELMMFVLGMGTLLVVIVATWCITTDLINTHEYLSAVGVVLFISFLATNFFTLVLDNVQVPK